jgi:acyl transferase domain-containing protein/NAD(P)-dependent dehydrogenase (short-subunit alcohol dehydrogenase family)/acyl-CoA thioesterase FadM
MSYFATPYTIHFDDTMAYGSHHFLTAFKFQCAAREALLFGQHVYDVVGVREALEQVHLLTVDAYTRNLQPAQLGERLAILLTIEEWGRGSVRFCYRVLGQQQKFICAGFQTIVCADAATQVPRSMPQALGQALEALRELEEQPAAKSFRQRVLAGGSQVDSLFGPNVQQAASQFLATRYPSPQIVSSDLPTSASAHVLLPTQANPQPEVLEQPRAEAWVFAGQGSLDPALLCQRLAAYRQIDLPAYRQLQVSCEQLAETWGPAIWQLFSANPADIAAAIQSTHALSQIAIHLQNVLGAKLRLAAGNEPAYLLGHSFGEIAALETAGCFDLNIGLRIVSLRVRALEQHAPAGAGLMVASCNRSSAEAEARIHGYAQVVVAGRNHDKQTLLSGPNQQLIGLKDKLHNLGISATLVPSSTSFHHPQLRSAAEHWLADLRGLPLRPPNRPVFSAIGRRVIGVEDDVAAVLVGQFLRPFDLQGAVHELASRGVTTFVDCGSAGGLARLLTKAGALAVEACTEKDLTSSVQPSASPVERPHERSAPSPQITSGPVPKPAPPGAATHPSSLPTIAIVGQGCLLPGGVSSPAKLYSAIAEQRVGIVDLRDHDPHWSAEFFADKLTPDRSNSHLSGRIDDQDIQPPPGIDPELFQGLSRTQQLLCVALAPCLAGLHGAERVGCFIGATADGFEDLDNVAAVRYAGLDPCDPSLDACLRTAHAAQHTPHAAVQQVFDLLCGPDLEVTLVDAACASSLYAVALGMRALETNQFDAVIAGGVFCPGPGNSCLFSQFRGTTSSGCRPFDAGADGVVFSEGSALISLRRLDDAERWGLPIDATVIGAGLSSDGKSSSANVPQTRGQILSLQRCYHDYAIDPATIVAIEGHGTSTPVGDSTELETLRQFFAEHTTQPLPIHSLKGLLGHAGWAAGTASIIAACEFMHRRIFPAQAMHRTPSAALLNSAETLTVPQTPVSLHTRPLRLAVDGFGFGGANAHVVLEAYQPSVPYRAAGRHVRPVSRATSHDEPVIVAYDQIVPHSKFCFPREHIKLPAHCVVLPQLAEDMDISQILVSILTEQILAQLPQCPAELRQATSLVLAMSGKTERGVEAILRIMTQRFRRLLSGQPQLIQKLEAAYRCARPSGAYTLQCMMPNVAAGRAALLSNLNGPNFVVDQGPASLMAALKAASLILCAGPTQGPKLAIVAAIDASSKSLPTSDRMDQTAEFAAAVALTTRRCAQQLGMPIVSTLNSALRVADLRSTHGPGLPPWVQVQRLLSALGTPLVDNSHLLTPHSTANTRRREAFTTDPSIEKTDSPSISPKESTAIDGNKCSLFVPVWIEKNFVKPVTAAAPSGASPLLCLVSERTPSLSEVSGALHQLGQPHLLVVVGNTGTAHEDHLQEPSLIRVDLSQPTSISAALHRIAQFAPGWVVAVDTVVSWDRVAVLNELAADNSLCEFLFLVAQSQVAQLKLGQLELWGLCVEGWSLEGGRAQVHPQSGPLAGLLKSISREFPKTRTGTLCTAGLALSNALNALLLERCQVEPEPEIACDHYQRRWVRRLRPANLTNRPDQAVSLNEQSVVLATGGAKGVTAVMLEALLRDSRCTVCVLGRSPLKEGPVDFERPEIEQAYYQRWLSENPNLNALELKRRFESARAGWEAFQTIQHLATLGGQVEYLQVDVTDSQQVTQAVEQIVTRYGRIDLLLHGAGIQKSKRLEDRSLHDFQRTFAVKVRGLHHLLTSCQLGLGQTVRAHLLTSAYSVFGNDGQHDYGAANETLDRLCELREPSAAKAWTSLAWLAWDGIGMTRGSEYRALAKSRRLSAVTPPLGQRLFREVLAGRTGAAIHVPMCDAEHVEYKVKTIPATVFASPTRIREVNVDLSGISCLPFHRVRDTPTLPGAWILDLLIDVARQIAPSHTPAESVVVHDLSFARFVRLARNQDPNLRVVAEAAQETIRVWMLTDILHPTGETLMKDVVCASATIRFETANTLEPGTPLGDFGEDLGHAADHLPVPDPYCTDHSAVSLSGLFDCLRDIQIGSAGRRARFNPNQLQDLSRSIPALLLDAAWRVGAMYADSKRDQLFVPVKIRRMSLPLQTVVNAQDLSACRIVSTPPTVENRTAQWERTEVFDSTGQLKMVVEDASATLLV